MLESFKDHSSLTEALLSQSIIRGDDTVAPEFAQQAK
jgi:hypothetical protein